MARIAGVPSTAWNPLLRMSTWLMHRRFGRSMQPLHGYALSRPVMLALAGLEFGMERAKRVDARVRMLAELRVAALVGCEFCLDIGSAIVRRLGVPERQLRDLNRYRDSEAFSALEKAVLEYADRMTATPVVVRDEDVDRLRVFFDETQIVELTAAIAHENLRARMNHALGYGAEGFTTDGVCALPAAAGTSHTDVASPIRIAG